MSTPDETIAQAILDNYPRLRVEVYCIFASTALLWFDFSLTFTTEVRRIWWRKFSGATVIYLLTRYIALVERVFLVTMPLIWNSSDLTCAELSHTHDVLTLLNYLAFSAFTIFRIYAISLKDWKAVLITAPLTLVKPGLFIIYILSYTARQDGPGFGCEYWYSLSDSTLARWALPVSATVETSRSLAVGILNLARDLDSAAAKATTIASDAILIALTWYRTYGIYKGMHAMDMRTPLTTLLLRDGTAYFLVLLAIQIVTIITSRIGSTLSVWLVWPYFEQTMTVIFLSRIMLNLRGLYFAERSPDSTLSADSDGMPPLRRFSDIHFATHIVGNLGATLDIAEACGTRTRKGRAKDPLAYPYPMDAPREVAMGGAAEDGVQEWCDDVDVDESPRYTSDPFAMGMKMPLGTGVAVDIVLEEDNGPSGPEQGASPA